MDKNLTMIVGSILFGICFIFTICSVFYIKQNEQILEAIKAGASPIAARCAFEGIDSSNAIICSQV
jgi:hypothetical protein